MAVPTPHLAVPVRTTAGEWRQGRRVEGKVPVPAEEFACCLFMPPPAEEEANTTRRRRVKRPELLYEPFDLADNPVNVSAEDELDITAEELTGPAPVRWMVVGDPQPAGPPGDTPRVLLARLAKVKESEPE